ncbi:MAG: hypothetical protein WC758_08200 [Candidatus Woesearchaeota archaeon]|jgi:DnaJ-class molecular chaperone
MEKQIENLQHLYEIRSKKITKKVRCTNCYGEKNIETYPYSDCSECGGSGFIIKDDE